MLGDLRSGVACRHGLRSCGAAQVEIVNMPAQVEKLDNRRGQ
jgi:hypothetical protein